MSEDNCTTWESLLPMIKDYGFVTIDLREFVHGKTKRKSWVLVAGHPEKKLFLSAMSWPLQGAEIVLRFEVLGAVASDYLNTLSKQLPKHYWKRCGDRISFRYPATEGLFDFLNQVAQATGFTNWPEGYLTPYLLNRSEEREYAGRCVATNQRRWEELLTVAPFWLKEFVL